ncbi:MAG: hypothetical protein DCF25_17365 [Leptolyngbya foveolarum]|uniref:Uncharacterized protein n=1 Tax=Leptolyngbya foveolarum TaxID=47253 RepID=A0A2W4U5U6_9CYAN|nr:MAG: hypothetical protein DCF25_17365 [Leptolyngbya foveolarum]
MLYVSDKARIEEDRASCQLPRLLIKIKESLEVAKQFVYSQSDDLEAVEKIEKALHSIETISFLFDKSSSS